MKVIFNTRRYVGGMLYELEEVYNVPESTLRKLDKSDYHSVDGTELPDLEAPKAEVVEPVVPDQPPVNEEPPVQDETPTEPPVEPVTPVPTTGLTPPPGLGG